MAAATSVIGGMVRIDPVYTPAHLRGRGYAGAVTVEASRAALAAGATDVVQFTDPDGCVTLNGSRLSLSSNVSGGSSGF